MNRTDTPFKVVACFMWISLLCCMGSDITRHEHLALFFFALVVAGITGMLSLMVFGGDR